MRLPNFYQENYLWKKGIKYIAGVDEVGRGAWAGPIVAAAVILPPKIRLPGLRDSKMLKPNQRQELSLIIKEKALFWAIGRVLNQTLDKIGLTLANLLVMKRALVNLSQKPDFLLIDGNLALNWQNIPFRTLIKGDQKVKSIAAASILAKVSRDELMLKVHQKYPVYGFNQHKGYGTRLHYQMLYQNGICQFHRRSFIPIKQLITLYYAKNLSTGAKCH